jgi:hypothetical protein
MSDQFTRWLCPMCGEPGIDSWNKAMFDGLDHEGELPPLHILGYDCMRCWIPVTVAYRGPNVAPRAIMGPHDGPYEYEDAAMAALEGDLTSGVELLPSIARDADWSGGCVAAKAQLQ